MSRSGSVKSFWPTEGLWRHPDFLKLWAGQTISEFGSQFSLVALPLTAIYVLHAKAFAVAALTIFEQLPFLLFALPAGVWVDRLARRPILIVGDAGRALALASIPIAYAFDALHMWQLFVVAFAVGVLTVFFDVAYQSYLPSLVARDQLVEGNSKLQGSASVAQLAGPGVAGPLVKLVSAPYAILADVGSFLGSSAFVLSIRRPDTAPRREAERRGMKLELMEGLPLEGYHLYHAARADLLRRLERHEEAAAAYRRALELTRNEPERRFLSDRLEQIATP